MKSTRTLVRRAVAITAAGAAAFALAACGGSDDGASGHGSDHGTKSPSATAGKAEDGKANAADIAFAQGMIPHHRQAVEMAELAPDRAASDEVKKLADEIKKAQDPEIKTLSGWLTSWGEKVPAEGASGHGGHGGGGGMMTAEEMDGLEKASGNDFDTTFMELMIKHHEGAVEMARAEKSDGSYAPARKMADAIITSQTDEIERMNKLLGKG
ncbi:DUF305 domain-containing protein [Streptomyces sp. NPDC050418]|uniref:DUF305 domain-containing protein n=1 Tax=Streptomyces sp. NPDC050418 TaxID=3365612 RepID=UPI003798E09D